MRKYTIGTAVVAALVALVASMNTSAQGYSMRIVAGSVTPSSNPDTDQECAPEGEVEAVRTNFGRCAVTFKVPFDDPPQCVVSTSSHDRIVGIVSLTKRSFDVRTRDLAHNPDDVDKNHPDVDGGTATFICIGR